MSTTEVLQKYSSFGLNKSKISPWLKQKDAILKNAVGEAKNMCKVNQRRNTAIYLRTDDIFLEAKWKRHKVHFKWLWSKATITYRRQLDDLSATVRKHVLVNIIKTNH